MTIKGLTQKQLYYLLGLIWADGHVSKRRIELEGLYEDLYPIESWATKLLPRIYDRQRKHYRKIRLYHSAITKLRTKFYEMDFHIKNKTTPQFLQNETQRIYFIRGFFDGDGSVNMSNKTNRQLNFSGRYEQNWSWIELLFNNLQVTYKIYRSINKKGHKSSMIKTCGRKNIAKVFKYLYPQGYDFGLKRKFDKFNEILI